MKKTFPKSIGHITHYVLLHVSNVDNVTDMIWLSYQRKQEALGKEFNCVFNFRRAKRVATHSTTKVKIEKEKNICCTVERCITSGAGCSQFTTRIPSKLAYIRHSDQNS